MTHLHVRRRDKRCEFCGRTVLYSQHTRVGLSSKRGLIRRQSPLKHSQPPQCTPQSFRRNRCWTSGDVARTCWRITHNIRAVTVETLGPAGEEAIYFWLDLTVVVFKQWRKAGGVDSWHFLGMLRLYRASDSLITHGASTHFCMRCILLQCVTVRFAYAEKLFGFQLEIHWCSLDSLPITALSYLCGVGDTGGANRGQGAATSPPRALALPPPLSPGEKVWRRPWWLIIRARCIIKFKTI